MDTLLRQLNGDVATKEAFKSFMDEFIASEALKRMYNKEDVSHIKDAHDLINLTFDELNNIYGIKEKAKPHITQSK